MITAATYPEGDQTNTSDASREAPIAPLIGKCILLCTPSRIFPTAYHTRFLHLSFWYLDNGLSKPGIGTCIPHRAPSTCLTSALFFHDSFIWPATAGQSAYHRVSALPFPIVISAAVPLLYLLYLSLLPRKVACYRGPTIMPLLQPASYKASPISSLSFASLTQHPPVSLCLTIRQFAKCTFLTL